MRSLERVAPPIASAEPPGAIRFLQDTLTIADGELRKVRHDPVELLTRAVQPILWLVIFGEVLSASRAIPTGSLTYMDFLAPGFSPRARSSAPSSSASPSSGSATWAWSKFLVAPASRVALVSGKGLAGGLRVLVQAAIIYIVAGLVGVHLHLVPLAIAGVCLVTCWARRCSRRSR